MQQPDVRERHRNRLRDAFSVKLVGFTGIVAAAVILTASWSLADGRLHVTFIDVGNGTATLIETPSGRQILVDGGGSGRKLSTGLGNALPFWDRRLDALVLTRLDASTTAGLPAALARYRFDAVVTSGTATNESSQSIQQVLRDSGAEFVKGQSGMSIQADDGVTLTVISAPTVSSTEGEEPDQPLVFMLAYGEINILVAGSTDAASVSALLSSSGPPNATVLLLPDQGRRDANPDTLLVAINPQAAIISIDAGNRSGLPDAETLDALDRIGAVVYRTDLQGSIEVISDGESYRVKTTR